VEVLPRTVLNPGSQHFVEAQLPALSVRPSHRPAHMELSCRLSVRPSHRPTRVGMCDSPTNNRIPTTSSLTFRCTSTPMAAWPGCASTAKCNATGHSTKPDELIDLAAAQNGALSIQCNDMFFSHMNNLIMPGRGVNMGDGWETKRNRTPNNRDWVIVRLAHKGIIQKALIDTCHFKGNYPDTLHAGRLQ
jgi:hypothetical protein